MHHRSSGKAAEYVIALSSKLIGFNPLNRIDQSMNGVGIGSRDEKLFQALSDAIPPSEYSNVHFVGIVVDLCTGPWCGGGSYLSGGSGYVRECRGSDYLGVVGGNVRHGSDNATMRLN